VLLALSADPKVIFKFELKLIFILKNQITVPQMGQGLIGFFSTPFCPLTHSYSLQESFSDVQVKPICKSEPYFFKPDKKSVTITL